MSDGGASEPTTQMTKIKALQQKHPKKISFTGIVFGSNGVNALMKKITDYLNGVSTFAIDGDALYKTFYEVIKRSEN